MGTNIRVAVVGVGYLGRFHAQKYKMLSGCTLVGVVDTDLARANLVATELGVNAHDELDEILPNVDALSVAVTTSSHYEVAKRCLNAGKHVLVEKPLAATVGEAEELVRLAEDKALTMQVGFLERFNPAFQISRDRIVRPQFIETVRISSFLDRGSDVDVVLDLMSHDLDLILAIARAPVRDLHAVGKSLMTESTDLANVRLLFDDGCVANLTVSRISHKVERKMRVFQQDSYLSIDFAKPFVRIYQKSQKKNPAPEDMFSEEQHTLDKGDALLAEITAFVESIRTGTPAVVTGEDGLRAMNVAEQVILNISKNRLP